jgi:hypothetical protein
VKNSFDNFGTNWVMKSQTMTSGRAFSVRTNDGNVMTSFGKSVSESANTEGKDTVVVAD